MEDNCKYAKKMVNVYRNHKLLQKTINIFMQNMNMPQKK